jgi:hypothetical protein
VLIEDDYIYSEYHKCRSTGMPLEFFYKQHHILTPIKKFWVGYGKWRRTNNISLVVPTSLQYMQFLLKYFNKTESEIIQAKRLLLAIQGIRIGFAELVIASAIMVEIGLNINEVMKVSGLTMDPIYKCRKKISEITKPEFSEPIKTMEKMFNSFGS